MTANASMKPALTATAVLVLSLSLGAPFASAPARAQSPTALSAAKGRTIAFDRKKGNCLSCHMIKGGQLAGSIGPELKNLKSKYSRSELVAIVTDETKRNPQTVMPPFGRNRILTGPEIDAVVDFLQTL